jgi:hypothetical protein
VDTLRGKRNHAMLSLLNGHDELHSVARGTVPLSTKMLPVSSLGGGAVWL